MGRRGNARANALPIPFKVSLALAAPRHARLIGGCRDGGPGRGGEGDREYMKIDWHGRERMVRRSRWEQRASGSSEGNEKRHRVQGADCDVSGHAM